MLIPTMTCCVRPICMQLLIEMHEIQEPSSPRAEPSEHTLGWLAYSFPNVDKAPCGRDSLYPKLRCASD